jgi:superfamily II DNA or RNA helicase
MGLELTATPSVETSKKPIYLKYVVYKYSLGKAITDGCVKEPAVGTRKDFNSHEQLNKSNWKMEFIYTKILKLN